MSFSYSFIVFVLLLTILYSFILHHATGAYTSNLKQTHSISPASDSHIIVILLANYSLDRFERNLFLDKYLKGRIKVHQRFYHAIRGLIISGVDISLIRHREGVFTSQIDVSIPINVDTSKTMTLAEASTEAESWGIDRIDQYDLPLSNTYDPIYKGAGSDIYIIDSGIDTTHIEFSPNPSGRIVQNVWAADGLTLSENNDENGHGTFVAGIAGGNTIGVSAYANIYGLRAYGVAPTASYGPVLSAIDMVALYASRSNRTSILNLSLGVPCDGPCDENLLYIATENLVAQGIVVVNANGESNGDACHDSSGAPGSITVGATTKLDQVYPGNFGPCITIYAPGASIYSAWTSFYAFDTTSYDFITGSSAAAPHVAGVVAQILEVSPYKSPPEITLSLQCMAARTRLSGVPLNTVNLLLQIPKLNDRCIFSPEFITDSPTFVPSRKGRSSPSARPSEPHSSILPSSSFPSTTRHRRHGPVVSESPSNSPSGLSSSPASSANPSYSASTVSPAFSPSNFPSSSPSTTFSSFSVSPSPFPSSLPTSSFSCQPTSTSPSPLPSILPSNCPSIIPAASELPSRRPISIPSVSPSASSSDLSFLSSSASTNIPSAFPSFSNYRNDSQSLSTVIPSLLAPSYFPAQLIVVPPLKSRKPSLNNSSIRPNYILSRKPTTTVSRKPSAARVSLKPATNRPKL